MFCVVEMLNMKEWRAVCVMFYRRSFARDAVDGSVWMDRRRRLDATRDAEDARRGHRPSDRAASRNDRDALFSRRRK